MYQVVRGIMVHCDGLNQGITANLYDPAYLDIYCRPPELPAAEDVAMTVEEAILAGPRGIPRRTSVRGSIFVLVLKLRDVAELTTPGTSQLIGLINLRCDIEPSFQTENWRAKGRRGRLCGSLLKGLTKLLISKGSSNPEIQVFGAAILKTIECF